MADRIVQPERAFEVRVLDGDEPGRFEGYASVFGVVDSHGTVFDKGAFKKTIKERKGWVPIAWMHDIWMPIGRAEVKEDDKGLWVEGALDLDTQRGAEVYSGMKKGYITQMSHTFRKIKEKIVKAEDKSEIPHYLEVKLFEVSPVTTNFASNEEAEITEVRIEEQAPPPEEPRRFALSPGVVFQMGRVDALLREPLKGTLAGEPLRKPGDHLQGVQSGLERLERVMRGD